MRETTEGLGLALAAEGMDESKGLSIYLDLPISSLRSETKGKDLLRKSMDARGDREGKPSGDEDDSGANLTIE